MSLMSMMSIAGSGMAAEGARMTAVASNLANAGSAVDSRGQPYRAREVVFAAYNAAGGDGPAEAGMSGVRVLGAVESRQPPKTVYDPSNPLADASGYVRMSNVNPVDEMVNMISASRGYQADLDAFNLAKNLALRTLVI